MNAVLSVQGSAVPEEAKPSFLSRVFNKKKALKLLKLRCRLLLWRRSSRMLRWPPPRQPT